ncbi:Glycerate dehydrogenase [Pseudoruegeria aquimaris]|uniref:Glycerate dehydrogenase n=1 Tax=Pseudoruegeria aquimaris TaxID=393663 RepID=A0A1Y5SWD7_9RHOB|nr:D-glycerate dehydrogenase [Pseudoruegeria aquimaris]SLN48477.1 Glycerate dehydrogenase [Pseudoruegeria aquimaris]
MKSSLFVTRPLPEPVLEAARAAYKVTVRESNAPMTPADCAEALRGHDAILPTLRDQFTAEAFAGEGLRCRLLANFGVGYNHIDVEAARAAGVAVTNTPGAVTDATADIALTLILMTARRAGEGERMLRAGRWEGWHPTQLLGRHVTGSRLGVIGMGRIGKAIAKRCHFGFDMEVVFYNRSEVRDPGMPAHQLGSIEEVMGVSDVVVVAVPATPQTHHLIDAGAFAAMKPTGLFINIARGDIVDEAALIAALQSGRIAGAGLDVYEFEPDVPEALRAMENVTLLPHLGTAALNVRTEMGLMAVENLLAHARGEELPNRVG